MEKYYLTYEKVHKLVKAAAHKIQQDNYVPDVMVAIGGGGFIPARIMRTFLKVPIYAVGISAYDPDTHVRGAPVTVQWIDEVEQKLKGKKVLLVDEVDDTRTTLSYCLEKLLLTSLEDIRVFVLHHKNKPKDATLPASVSHIYHGECIPDIWTVYPWDAMDIAEHYAHVSA